MIKSIDNKYLHVHYEFEPYATRRKMTFMWLDDIEHADLGEYGVQLEYYKQLPRGSVKLVQVVRQEVE